MGKERGNTTNVQEDTSACSASAIAEDFDDLFEETDDSSGPTVAAVLEEVKSLADTAADIDGKLDALGDRLTEVASEIARLKTDDRVLTEMHERTRTLSEEFHEREVLTPILLALIGIADRSRQQVDEITRVAKSRGDSGCQSGLIALRRIADARTADRIEIENLLANFGVERFEHTGEGFEPEVHRCLERIETPDADVAGQIARRVLPGYRRGGRMIRQECVAVYVETKRAEAHNEEEGNNHDRN